MPSLTTPIQHSIGSPNHSNQTRKRNKMYPNGKGENKIVTVSHDMIVYVENLIDSNKKLLNLLSELGKTVGYKLNIQKSKTFLYINNETEIRKKSHWI